ncbi:MAG: hypothetical protein HYS06_13615 [Methylocystis sp.]|nr:hypothetical protein [Methylocystis sp.]MBI3275759.1 hypothetical protein [Methylocystis sp.]
MSEAIRRNYWLSLQRKHKPGAFEVLDAAYTESHRAYHTWAHIDALLEQLTAFSHLAVRPDLVATAIFWHDAVLRTQRSDGQPRPDAENVRDSCELFHRYTLLDGADADAVHDLIMATADHIEAKAKKQHYSGFAGDLGLFLDLDLSSLAAPWEEFVATSVKLRAESAWMPDAVFWASQTQVLQGFLKAEARLYRRAETIQQWRAAATANLTRYIVELQRRAEQLSSLDHGGAVGDSLSVQP